MEAEEEMKKGNFAKAREIFDKLLQKDKRKAQYFLGKADCFVLEGRLTDSLPIYCDAFKSGKVKPDGLSQLVKGLTKAIDIERERCRSGEVNKYGDVLQCGICTGMLCDPVTVPCGHTFCKLCLEKQETKKCEHCGEAFAFASLKANVILQDILEKSFDKELKAIHLRLEGNVLYKKKKSKEAIEKYLEAEKLNRADHLVQSNIACILISLGRFEESLLRANKACELQPDWPKGYYRRGCALVGLNRKTEAAVAFLHSLARDSDKSGVKKSVAKLIHEVITEESGPCSSCTQNQSLNDHSGCVPGNTDPILQRLTNLVDLVQQSKAGNVEEDTDSDEPDIKRLRLDKCCSVDDLECTLCCRLLYEPVTTPCGHVFCRGCLNCNLDHRPTCPICRFSLKKFLAERNQNITVAISRLIQTTLPEEYEERKKVHQEELEKLASVASDTTEDIPVFVCTLAFPSQPCPLHIFEPRYRLMVRQCMESGSKQFGMCVHSEEKGFVDYGVMLEIRDLQYLPDGRSFVDCIGGRRFKVLKRGMQNGYHTAKVEWIKDETIPEDELEDVKALHQKVYNEANSWFSNLPLLPRRRITNMFSEMPSCDTEIKNLPQGPAWMWWLLSVCPLPTELQMQFISMSSLKERLQKLEQLVASFQAYM